jgi:ATP-dependent HslUV protease ATP-binding subunit HslU
VNLTPRQIVACLDQYVIGQSDAKKAVAVAIRNRWRRQQLPEAMRDEVAPKNIIMIGPTGVGKTEIARRLATLIRAPFLKVEATKYTEVGYHGRDVESIIRDLTEISLSLVKGEQIEAVKPKARELAEERLLDLLLPVRDSERTAQLPSGLEPSGESESREESFARTREKLRAKLRAGQIDHQMIELRVPERSTPFVEIFSSSGIEQMGFDFQNLFENRGMPRTKARKMKVSEALEFLGQEEAEKLLDRESLHKEAIRRVEDSGIVFIDEIDKIAFHGSKSGPDVSREGVQRDLLPIVEGSTVVTRYGPVRTGHVLFLAAGAFHMSKVSDLIPELQGRFPIRVELGDLTGEDFRRILIEPNNALTKQYGALMATEGVTLEYEEDGIEEIARTAEEINRKTQNIGARRLQTVMEKLLEDIAFEGSEIGRHVRIDRAFVQEKLRAIVEDEDLSHYIL